MVSKFFKDEEEFKDYFRDYPKLYKFVESISGNNRWWFNDASVNEDGNFNIIFTSYKTPEYRNFLLSIYAKKVNKDYVFSITKQITNLA